MSVLDIAKDYIARGWAPVPIVYRKKNPTIDNWPQLVVTENNVEQYFNGGEKNIGVILGPKSGGLSDVDLDCDEAVVLAPHLLPPTGAVFGRQSKPKSHYLYIVNDPEPKAVEKYLDQEGSTIIELRVGGGSKGSQTVFPGSMHSSGEAVQWVADGAPAKITFKEILERIQDVAVGTLLLKGWPPKSRHNCSLIAGGFLARAGWDADRIGNVIAAVCEETGSNVTDGRAAATDAAGRWAQEGGNVYGYPAMVEAFGEPIAKRISAILDLKEKDKDDDVLNKMNDRFCVLSMGGKMRVLEFKKSLGRDVANFYPPFDFKGLFDNHKIKIKKANGEDKFIGHGSWWLERPNRKQYESLVFKPGAPHVIEGDLNLWRGWGVPPKAGKWDLMKNHINKALSGGEEKNYEYIMNWLAWTFQNPGTRAEVVIVLRGGKGTGKGLFGREIKKIFGQHGMHISSVNHLTGKFNHHLMDCAFLFADEAFWPGDKSANGALKRMVTEDTLFIEKKGVDAFEVDNCLHILMASNEDWIVPASIDERRFAIFEVDDAPAKDKNYFKPIYEEAANGGSAAMLHELLARDIKGWHPRDDVPQTKGLRDQQDLSLDPFHQWWVERLHDGALPDYDVERNLVWSKNIFRHMRETSPALRNLSDQRLGRSLRLFDAVATYADGARGWRFPSLPEARQHWAEKMKQTVMEIFIVIETDNVWKNLAF